jgi:type IV pilus assembly protein PilB
VIVKKRLGEMLIEERLLTEEQLNKALAEQSKAGLKLGQFLMRQGIISENQIVDILGRQLKLRKYHPDNYPFDMELAQLIPIDYAQKYQVAPLIKKGRLLTVAMNDPLDINALDTIEMLTNNEVEAVVCTEKELNQLISSLYGVQSGLGSILESMEIEAQPDRKSVV